MPNAASTLYVWIYAAATEHESPCIMLVLAPVIPAITGLAGPGQTPRRSVRKSCACLHERVHGRSRAQGVGHLRRPVSRFARSLCAHRDRPVGLVVTSAFVTKRSRDERPRRRLFRRHCNGTRRDGVMSKAIVRTVAVRYRRRDACRERTDGGRCRRVRSAARALSDAAIVLGAIALAELTNG